MQRQPRIASLSERPLPAQAWRPSAMARPKPLAAAKSFRRRDPAVAWLPDHAAGADAGLTAEAVARHWNEHAIKTGIVMFWLWFAVANWKSFQLLLQAVAAHWGAGG